MNGEAKTLEDRAAQLLETRLAAISGLSAAAEAIAAAQDQLSTAEKQMKTAREAATKAGWTPAELKSLGVVPEARKGSGARRPKRSTGSSPAPAPTSSSEATSGPVEGAEV